MKMKSVLAGLMLVGCGLIPDEATLGGTGVVPETKTCYDTSRVIGADSVEIVVTPRECRTGEVEWQW